MSQPDAAPLLSPEELVALLNTLLEAERAGAKVLAAFMGDYTAESDAWRTLRDVQRDEARNCAILIRLIRGLGGTPSEATGDFVGKALAVQGNRERLALLNRGQGWVARLIGQHLSRIDPADVRDALTAMHASHVENIARCDALLR